MHAQVMIYKMGLESQVAHYISQGLVCDPEMNVERTLEEFRSLFLSFGIDNDTVSDIIHKGREQGLMEYITGLTPAGIDAAAQIHPTCNPVVLTGAERLASLLKQYLQK